ncbi:MAG: DUF4386 domain-containing protein [Sphaerochaetaceae bacterium]|nr:DUF4386 domain-containing protein [Sphaerochaetaceae bacterium]
MPTIKDTRRKSALMIGISLFVMAVAAGIAFGAIHSSLIDTVDTDTTMKNLLQNSSKWQTELLLWVMIIITDLLVSWGVYLYFRNASPKLSIYTAGFRVVYTLFLSVAVSQLMVIAPSAQDGNTQKVMLLLTRFDRFWSYGLILFSIHLILLAIVSFRFESRVVGILLLAAGISYLILHTMESFLPGLSAFTIRLETILMIPMTLGEMVFAFWMIIRGGKSKGKVVS